MSDKPSERRIPFSSHMDLIVDTEGTYDPHKECKAERDELRSQVATLRERIAELETQNQRLHDLVRYKRHDLFDDGLITDDEFSELVEDHTAVARLEGYDAMKAERDRALSELAELAKLASAFAAKIKLVEPALNGYIGLHFARTGQQYGGPNYGQEQTALENWLAARAAIAREPEAKTPDAAASPKS